MNDQTPIRYKTKSEPRSEITYLSESDWEKSVHRLVILLDRALSKAEKISDSRRVTSEIIERRQKTMKRRCGRPQTRDWSDVRAFIARHPAVHVASISRRLDIAESTVRRIRKELGLPLFHPGRNLIHRFAELLAQNPEISNEDAAKALEATPGYLKKVRIRLEAQKEGRPGRNFATGIRGTWE